MTLNQRVAGSNPTARASILVDGEDIHRGLGLECANKSKPVLRPAFHELVSEYTCVEGCVRFKVQMKTPACLVQIDDGCGSVENRDAATA